MPTDHRFQVIGAYTKGNTLESQNWAQARQRDWLRHDERAAARVGLTVALVEFVDGEPPINQAMVEAKLQETARKREELIEKLKRSRAQKSAREWVQKEAESEKDPDSPDPFKANPEHLIA